MILTHLSHFGMTKIAETADNAVFSGSLANCKRMAYAHGCAVHSEEFSPSAQKAVRHWLIDEDGNHAGSIHLSLDDITYVLSLEIWRAD